MDNPKIRLGLENSNAITCEACENDTFVEANYLRRVSKLLTGSADDMVVPVPTFLCSKCGHINANFKIQDAKPTDSKISLD
jgi:hypothetical protein